MYGYGKTTSTPYRVHVYTQNKTSPQAAVADQWLQVCQTSQDWEVLDHPKMETGYIRCN